MRSNSNLTCANVYGYRLLEDTDATWVDVLFFTAATPICRRRLNDLAFHFVQHFVVGAHQNCCRIPFDVQLADKLGMCVSVNIDRLERSADNLLDSGPLVGLVEHFHAIGTIWHRNEN